MHCNTNHRVINVTLLCIFTIDFNEEASEDITQRQLNWLKIPRKSFTDPCVALLPSRCTLIIIHIGDCETGCTSKTSGAPTTQSSGTPTNRFFSTFGGPSISLVRIHYYIMVVLNSSILVYNSTQSRVTKCVRL